MLVMFLNASFIVAVAMVGEAAVSTSSHERYGKREN
jgi:hypothetical protein